MDSPPGAEGQAIGRIRGDPIMTRLMITRSVVTICAIVFLFNGLPDLASADPWTPIAWKDNGKLRDWVRDTNNNFVDDLIEAREDSMSVVVDLNSCVGGGASSPIVTYLNTLGDVVYVGKYITLVVVAGIDREEARQIGARGDVAMVELADGPGQWNWDEYEAAKVASSPDYAQNLEDNFSWPGTLDGSGANVAILDTGVGPAYNASFRHGYNALTDTV